MSWLRRLTVFDVCLRGDNLSCLLFIYIHFVAFSSLFFAVLLGLAVRQPCTVSHYRSSEHVLFLDVFPGAYSSFYLIFA